MNILFLSPRLPYPTDTGAKIRTFNILKQLAKGASVDVLSFSFEVDDAKHLSVFDELGINVKLVPIKNPSLLWKVWTVFFSRQPISVKKYFTQDMACAVKSALNEKTYDLIHIDHIHMAHYRKFAGDIPCFLDEHNVEFKILERFSQMDASWIKRPVFKIQAIKMKSFEAREAAKFQGCTVVSQDDKELLAASLPTQVSIEVIANGVDTEFFQENDSVQKESNSLVFTGSMDWLPNEDAVVYFCKEILPLIWMVKRDVTLTVVGKSPTFAIRELASKDKRIVVTGRVDDVRPFMDKAQVFVVPIRIGGGTRLKILEAMSMKNSVVSMTVGAEGIAYKDGEDIVIADKPEAFAEAVIHFLDNEDKRKAIGPKARELVLGTYDWSIVGQRLLEFYKKEL